MSQTIFVRPGARRPYVPAGALKDARAECERYRKVLKDIMWEARADGQHEVADMAREALEDK